MQNQKQSEADLEGNSGKRRSNDFH